MNPFVFEYPTKVYFGKGAVANLSGVVEKLTGKGAKVLLVYGGGSIKRSGLYDEIRQNLQAAEAELFELSGVEPNPKLTTVEQGVALCLKEKIGCIVAAGGGSAIDCAKAVSVIAATGEDAWEIVKDSSKIIGAIPLIAIPTLTATGTETDGYSVISNSATGEKVGISSVFARPAVAIMDPNYTCSVNAWQTGAGTCDIFSHLLEVYFTRDTGTYLKNRMCEAVMRTVIHYGPIALVQPDNYEARSNLMWAASVAISGELALGNRPTSWSCHGMEHPLSGVYDITHGAGLAVLIPAWMRYILSEQTAPRLAEYANLVWDVPKCDDLFAMAREGIARTEAFFRQMGMPSTLRELGIKDGSKFKSMAEDGVKYSHLAGAYVPLSVEDVVQIYKTVL